MMLLAIVLRKILPQPGLGTWNFSAS